MPSDAVVPATIASGLIQTARHRGLDYPAWLDDRGLTEAGLEGAEATISYRDSIYLIERAVAAAPSAPLGIEVGSRSALTPMGMVGFAMMSCRDVRQAMEFGLSHDMAAGSLLDFAVQTDKGQGLLVLSERKPEPRAAVFLYEEALSSVHLLIEAMLGDTWQPLAVQWPFAQPGYLQAYRDVFRCPMEFDAPRCALQFDPAILDQKLKNYSEINLKLAQQACRQLIESIGAQDNLVLRVRSTLRAHMPQRIGIYEVARALQCSERSLRRRLNECGASYRKLRDAEWAGFAERELNQQGRTVAQVAERMGLGIHANFGALSKTGLAGHRAVSKSRVAGIPRKPFSGKRYTAFARISEQRHISRPVRSVLPTSVLR